MDAGAVRAAYDEQVRRQPEPGAEGWVEHDDRVVRVHTPGGWSAVTWSGLGGLGGDEVDATVAHQVARFVEVGAPWEWKLYSYDEPVDLGERLVTAGLTRAEEETLLVAEVAELDLNVVVPQSIRLEPVVDQAGVDAVVAVHDQVFGGDHSRVGRELAAGLAAEPASVAAVVAMAEETAVSAGRVEFHDGTDFASIWGGGTLAPWRGRGIFRALVAYRARQAAERGFRYLQVDATPDSRPILTRLGFVELATTTPYDHPGLPLKPALD